MSTFDVLDSFASLRRKIALLRAAETKDLEFGHNQIIVLYKLSLAPATMGELADHLSCDKASITRTVSSLKSAGLVRRTDDAGDRRRVVIELTSKGKIQAQKAHAIRDAIGRKLDAALNSGERKQLAALVQKIIQSLE